MRGPHSGRLTGGCEATGVTTAQYGHLNPNPANQYNGLLGGNPNLEPEIADTYSVGLVLTPRWSRTCSSRSTTLTSDQERDRDHGRQHHHQRLRLRGPVLRPGAPRPGNGSLWLSTLGYVTEPINEGKLGERGFDFKGNYRLPLPALGSLLFRLDATYLESLETTPVAGQGSYDCAGYYGDICGGEERSGARCSTSPGRPPGTGWTSPSVALLRRRDHGAAQPEQVPGGDLFLPAAGAHPGLQLLRSVGHVQYLQEHQAGAGCQQHCRQGSADRHPGRLLDQQRAGANCNGNTFPGVYDAMGRYLFAPSRRSSNPSTITDVDGTRMNGVAGVISRREL